MKKYSLTIGAVFGVMALAVAQPLDTLVAMAMQQNPELQGMYLEYRAALEQGPQVSEWPDPEVGVGVSILPVETRLGPQWVRLGVTQMFPWMGTLQAREDVVLTMARAKYERAEALRLEVAYRVGQAYYRLYELRRRREIIRRNLSLFESLERLALGKVESGQTTTADVLRTRLRIQELEQQLLLLENQEGKPLAALNQVLNRPVGAPVTLPDSLPAATLPFNRDTLAGYIRANHPALQAMTLQQESSRRVIELNSLGQKPTFGAGFDYIFNGKRTDAEPPGNGRDAIGVRGMVRVPLFTKKYAAKEQEETLKIEALEQQKIDMQSKFLAAIEQAYVDFRDAELQLDLYRRQQATLEAAINVLTTRYSTEGMGFDELLRLQVEQVNYDMKILEASVKSHLARVDIERMVRF